MIEVYALGDALIKVGDREVRPTSPLVFAALLYLCVERGRRISRRELQELLFPDARGSQASHSLRQLIYKLRRLGAPLSAVASHVAVPPTEVVLAHCQVGSAISEGWLRSRSVEILPGVSTVSRAFTEWLASTREFIRHDALMMLRTAMDASRLRSDAAGTERYAAGLVALDVLNCDAHVALAEALALQGRHNEAVETLARYAQDAPDAPSGARAHQLLRKLRLAIARRPGEGLPLLGRSLDMAFLTGHLRAARSEGPAIIALWGDAGIGKTRLAEDFSAVATLNRVRTIRTSCRSHDAARPFATILALLPELLALPGALGTSPSALGAIRDVAQGTRDISSFPAGPTQYSFLTRAIVELFEAVATEMALLLTIDNANWLDKETLSIMADVAALRVPILVLLTDRSRFASPEMFRSGFHSHRLDPLDDVASRALLDHLLGPDHPASPTTRRECLALARGNPLFIRTLSEHLRLGREVPTAGTALGDVLRMQVQSLSGRAALLLRMIAVCQPHARIERLRSSPGLSESDYLLALQELSENGLISREEGSVTCWHDALADIIAADCPDVLRIALQASLAETIERGASTTDPRAFWDAAELWRRAGEAERQLRALEACADHSVHCGQLILAMSAIEQALRIADYRARPQLLVRKMEVAGGLTDDAVATACVTELRGLLTVLPKAQRSAVRLTEISARRRLGEPTCHFHEELEALALDADLAAEHRLKAVRLFLGSAQQYLEAERATALYQEIRTDDSLTSDSLEWWQVEANYHLAFGDMHRAAEVSEALLDRIDSFAPARAALLLGNIGLTLVKSGKVAEGLSAVSRGHSVARDFGLLSLDLFGQIRMAVCCYVTDDFDSFLKWHYSVEAFLQRHSIPTPAAQLAHRIDAALLLDDLSSARRALDGLWATSEIQKPYHLRFPLAFENILLARGAAPSERAATLDQLEKLDLQSRIAGDHDFFAFALFLARSAAGDSLRARKELVQYCHAWRRELQDIPGYIQAAITPSTTASAQVNLSLSIATASRETERTLAGAAVGVK